MTTKHTEICPKTILQNDNENNIMRFCQKIIIIKCLEISYEEKKRSYLQYNKLCEILSFTQNKINLKFISSLEYRSQI
jgi:hypothetical protein